jgi:hypothetical protein
LRNPSPIALERGDWFARKNENYPAAVRIGFIRSDDGTPPPLARMVRAGSGGKGGRGGEVALKLYLSLLLISRWGDTTTYPAQFWAELLDLRNPPTDGARRVRDAMDWLEKNHFIRVNRRKGHPSELELLDDRSTGGPYTRPDGYEGDRYRQLPATFWRLGWVAVLSAAGIAILLILSDQEPGKPIWLSPLRRKHLYTLSDETFYKGSHELKAYGIVEKERRLEGEVHNFKRLRNIYHFTPARLNFSPMSSNTLAGTDANVGASIAF